LLDDPMEAVDEAVVNASDGGELESQRSVQSAGERELQLQQHFTCYSHLYPSLKCETGHK